MKWAICRRVKRFETRSWTAGHAIWVAVLICYLALTTIWAGPNVVAWGVNWYGQTNVPDNLTNAVAVVAGGNHNLALRAEGTVVVWGAETHVTNDWSSYGPATVPDDLGNVLAVATAENRSLALRADGTVVAWGAYDGDQTNVPAGLTNGVAVAAGSSHSLVLRSDGTVVAWGQFPNSGLYRPMTVPIGLSNVVTVAAGERHSLALRADGTVVAWGANCGGQTNVPASLANVVAVAGGDYHSLALRADGTVVAWGNNSSGQTQVPSGLTNVVAVAGGSDHSLAVIGRGAPFLTTPLVDRRIFVGGTVYFLAAVSGAWPLSYQWQFNGTNLPRATNSLLVLADVQPAQAGEYSVVVSNAWGTVTSREAQLQVNVVTTWGGKWGDQELHVPAGLTNIVQVVATGCGLGGIEDLALRDDGTVVAWNQNRGLLTILTNLPAGLTNVVAVAAGGTGGPDGPSLALRADGTVVAWGTYWDGTTNVPVTVPPSLTNVVAVAAGWDHSLALRADGTVVAWGNNSSGETDIPSGLTNVVAVSGGDAHSLALTGDGSPVIKASLSHPALTAEGFSVSLPTQSGRVYALEYKNSLEDATWTSLPLVAGTGRERTLTDPTATGAQRFYRVRRW